MITVHNETQLEHDCARELREKMRAYNEDHPIIQPDEKMDVGV